jgi:hypothetical protein
LIVENARKVSIEYDNGKVEEFVDSEFHLQQIDTVIPVDDAPDIPIRYYTMLIRPHKSHLA